MLGRTPEPMLWPTWRAVVDNRRNARGLSFEYVDTHGATAERLWQRAKPPSASGEINLHPPSTGRRLSSATPMWKSRAKMLLGSDSPSEESPQQIVRADKVA